MKCVLTTGKCSPVVNSCDMYSHSTLHECCSHLYLDFHEIHIKYTSALNIGQICFQIEVSALLLVNIFASELNV